MKKILFLLVMVYSMTIFAKPLPNAQVLPDQGTVALTFDDGPSPIYTPQVLAILKKNNIKATFFVMGGQAKRYPQLIKDILADGHAIAIHSMTHPNLNKLNKSRWYFEMVEPKIIVANIIGKTPSCLRPPFGIANAEIKNYLRSQGIIPVSMGFNSFDYERPGVQKLTNWVIKNAHNRQVILLHDGYAGRQQTVAALPMIIEGIRKKGLGFSAICYPHA